MYRIKELKNITYIGQITILLIFLISFLFRGINALSESYLWIAYIIVITLTLPSLISKVLFKSTLLGIWTVVSFLYFPLGFIISYAFSSLLNTDLRIPLVLFGLFNILLWNLLFYFYIKENKKDYLFWISDKLITSIFASTIIIVIVFLVLRQVDSLIATDYLQHQSVVNNLINNQLQCIVPSQCSNLFLQDGYTTFFHTIWASLSFFTINNLQKVFFVIDLIWPVIIGLCTFKYATRIFKNDLIAAFCVVISTLVFANWAYEFNFLIPQTLVFFLFLNLIALKKLTPKQLIVGSLVLILGHFVMGLFLSGILFIKFVVLKQWKDIYKKTSRMNFVLYLSFGVVFLSLLLNIAGFSIETIFQKNEINYIGGATNSTFPGNLEYLFAPLSFLSIILVLSIVYYFRQKRKNFEILFAIVYICINISVFLLAPTYAGKFLIGFGIFASFLIANYVKGLKLKPYRELLIIILIIAGLVGTFCLNLSNYLKFYKRENNIVSALAPSDYGLISYLKENNIGCQVISDPYTQIVIAGLTDYQTMNGQYMSLEARESIMKFINEPSINNYSELKSHLSNSEESVCFIYSGRLEGSLYEGRTAWVKNIYTLPIRNDYSVMRNNGLRVFMEENQSKILFEDNAYILFED